jgi:hypothetical protein
MRPSVDDFAVDEVFHRIEMRYVERAHGLDGQCERLICVADCPRLAQPLTRGTQRAQHLCAVEPLPLAVVTETHTHFLPDRARLHNGVGMFDLRQERPALL